MKTETDETDERTCHARLIGQDSRLSIWGNEFESRA